ncbi:MAG: protein kinase [Deltaproteobacteria bacterium]|jgi:serine/threonine protein kinase|nr:protein kinase [Deltaproteobacteria bacterium]
MENNKDQPDSLKNRKTLRARPYNATIHPTPTGALTLTAKELTSAKGDLRGQNLVPDNPVSPSTPALASFRAYPIVKTLSSAGGEADIFIIHDHSNKEYVLRLYRQGQEPLADIFKRMPQISSDLQGLAVYTFEADFDQETSRFYELQEYLPFGDLANFYKDRKISLKEFWALLSQLSKAIHLLHSRGVIHRDLKPDNVLLRSLDPIQVAIADFGISTLLDSKVSIKETQAIHTPLYSPPESFANFVGPGSDYWSLGVILLEGILGKHPLVGLSLNMVTREISSRGISVPEDLPENISYLLSGLLTRDYRYRWGYQEISAFLKGSLPPVYSLKDQESANPSPAPGDYPNPFHFLKTAYFSPKELAIAFTQSPDTWKSAKESIQRGLIRDWLEANQAYDEVVKFEAEVPPESEILLFSFIQSFAPETGHVFRGLSLDLPLVLKLLNVPHESLDPLENSLYEDILAGKLTWLSSIAQKNGNPLPPQLEILFSWGKPLSRSLILGALLVFENPQNFFWGGKLPPDPPSQAMKFQLACKVPLVGIEFLRNEITPETVLPEDLIIKGFKDPENYHIDWILLQRILGILGTIKDERFFYRYREEKIPGFSFPLRLSPLKRAEYLSYLNFRTFGDTQESNATIYIRERIILEQENKAKLSKINPFVGIYYWLGNVLPSVLLFLITGWFFLGNLGIFSETTIKFFNVVVNRFSIWVGIGLASAIFVSYYSDYRERTVYSVVLVIILFIYFFAVAINLEDKYLFVKEHRYAIFVLNVSAIIFLRYILGHFLRNRIHLLPRKNNVSENP